MGLQVWRDIVCDLISRKTQSISDQEDDSEARKFNKAKYLDQQLDNIETIIPKQSRKSRNRVSNLLATMNFIFQRILVNEFIRKRYCKKAPFLTKQSAQDLYNFDIRHPSPAKVVGLDFHRPTSC